MGKSGHTIILSIQICAYLTSRSAICKVVRAFEGFILDLLNSYAILAPVWGTLPPKSVANDYKLSFGVLERPV